MLRRGGTVLGSLGVAGRLHPDPSTGEGDDPEPAIVAHRGCAAEHPENTIVAVEAAAGVADAVEVDVRRCGTGELVVFHDDTLDRLTAETGRVDRTPCETVTALEVGDSGGTIPTLEAVFEVVPPAVPLDLDLKEPGLVADVLALREKYDHDVLVSSFHPSVLEAAREADASVRTAYIVQESFVNRLFRPAIPGLPSWLYGPEDVSGTVTRATALDCDAICPRYELCLRTDLVSRAHAADLCVMAWTITTSREFEVLRAVGVDAVISDVCTGLRE